MQRVSPVIGAGKEVASGHMHVARLCVGCKICWTQGKRRTHWIALAQPGEPVGRTRKRNPIGA